MRLEVVGRRETTMGGAPLAIAFKPVPRLVTPGLFKQAVVIGGDVLGLAGIALCIPFVIIAIGTPFALGIRFLLWMVGAL